MAENKTITLEELFESWQTVRLFEYKKGYTPESVQEEINRLNYDGLSVDDVFDKLDNLSFLKDYGFLKKLYIYRFRGNDFDFFNELTELDSLTISSTEGLSVPVNLSALQSLEFLSLEWQKGKIKGLENCQKLEKLIIWSYKESDFTPLSQLKALKSIEIKTGSIKSATGLEELTNLENVVFGNCRSLTSISALAAKSNLRRLEIDTCSKIADYDSLGVLPNLENLEIINCKGIPSIGFIRNFPKLKVLGLRESTEVLDGDLTPALNLKRVYYKPRKYYNVVIESP